MTAMLVRAKGSGVVRRAVGCGLHISLTVLLSACSEDSEERAVEDGHECGPIIAIVRRSDGSEIVREDVSEDLETPVSCIDQGVAWGPVFFGLEPDRIPRWNAPVADGWIDRLHEDHLLDGRPPGDSEIVLNIAEAQGLPTLPFDGELLFDGATIPVTVTGYYDSTSLPVGFDVPILVGRGALAESAGQPLFLVTQGSSVPSSEDPTIDVVRISSST